MRNAQLHSEDWLTEQREAVAAHIATGFAQAERGELMDGEAAVEMLHQRRAPQSGSALSQGERVARDGAFTSRRGPGEGSVARRGRIRQARRKLLARNE